MTKRKISFSSILSPIGRHKITSLAVLVVLVVIGIFVYQAVAVKIEKHNFEQARAAIDKVYADIVNQVGQPDSHRRTNECSRPNQEFGRGQLSCAVSTDLAYGVLNEAESEIAKAKVQTIFAQNSELFKKSGPPATYIYTTPAPGTIPASVDYYKTSGGVVCAVKYTFDMPREIELTIKDPSKKIFGISIECSANAHEQYYPSEN